MFTAMKHSCIAISAAVVAISSAPAIAGTAVEETGVIVCVSDKWDEKEIAKDHKKVDYAGRCVKVPDDASATKTTEACAGTYEYMPDGSWKASGTCTATQKPGDTLSATWEEGSTLAANPYKITGGTGKFKGAAGGGTYKYDQLTDTLFGGRYSGKIELP
ncbi:MAG: hypothetical protein NW216_03450 [Hyphomicrobium sp.]|nr:hypothetical protein [Hyphomicrobium sp.]